MLLLFSGIFEVNPIAVGYLFIEALGFSPANPQIFKFIYVAFCSNY